MTPVDRKEQTIAPATSTPATPPANAVTAQWCPSWLALGQNLRCSVGEPATTLRPSNKPIKIAAPATPAGADWHRLRGPAGIGVFCRSVFDLRSSRDN
jgi:hypothetical protein